MAATSPASDAALAQEAERFCRDLLGMDTRNPPGNERPAADYLMGALQEAGYAPTLLESAETRANLVCRYQGSGELEPLLLTAHLDVVEVDEARWKYPPFEGRLEEGCLWGRGAVDMKNMAAMCTAIMRKLARDKPRLKRDVIFAAVADEEAGCEYGSKWLVENHRELVQAEYAIGEVGGFSMHIGNQTFYPVQVAEKGFCWIVARVRGEAGHGSMPRSDSAVVRMAEAVAKLGKAHLPVHPTKYLQQFLAGIASAQSKPVKALAGALTEPAVLATLLRLAPKYPDVRSLLSLLSNTASPTVVRAGSKVNVIPGLAEFQIDGRTLPGQSDADLISELQDVLGPDVELEVMRSAPPVTTDDTESPLYNAIRRQIGLCEPDATVVPYMIPGFTDAKFFTQMGAKWYGFSPVKIERGSGIKFAEMFHGHNERIPVAGLHWGAQVLDAVVRDFCGEEG